MIVAGPASSAYSGEVRLRDAAFAFVLNLIVFSSAVAAQTPTTAPDMCAAWCASCHAQGGTGRVPVPTVTVEPMDFTDCAATTPVRRK